MQQVIKDAGYQIQYREEPGSQQTEEQEAAVRRSERRSLKFRVILGAILTLPVLYAGMVGGFISEDLVPALLDNHWFQLWLTPPSRSTQAGPFTAPAGKFWRSGLPT